MGEYRFSGKVLVGLEVLCQFLRFFVLVQYITVCSAVHGDSALVCRLELSVKVLSVYLPGQCIIHEFFYGLFVDRRLAVRIDRSHFFDILWHNAVFAVILFIDEFLRIIFFVEFLLFLQRLVTQFQLRLIDVFLRFKFKFEFALFDQTVDLLCDLFLVNVVAVYFLDQFELCIAHIDISIFCHDFVRNEQELIFNDLFIQGSCILYLHTDLVLFFVAA